MKKHHLIFACLFTVVTATAQAPLPKELTAAEQQAMRGMTFRSSALLSAPPPGNVRTAAEWEEVEYLVLSWAWGYESIQRQIIAAALPECKIIITTTQPDQVSAYLSSNGIGLEKITFLNQPANSIWIRDYAGNTIYTNDVGQRALVDWIYNRPRPWDDAMPSAHANLLNIPIYQTNTGTTDLVNTGGNFMSDGLGTAFASELVHMENAAGNAFNVTPKTPEQIRAIMQDYMGISNYVTMPVLPFDGIHHIDMHMKLLNEETLLVSRYPPGVADGPQIEANINYVQQNVASAFGTPYKIHRIDAPPSTSGSYPDTGGYYRTYTNAVFVNKTVILPVYRPEVDAAAIATYQELLPGYNIVGIDVDNAEANLISGSGAIHCITHTIGVADPLLIVHNAIEESQPFSTQNITALVKHVSGIANAVVFWRNFGEDTFNQTPMAFLGEDQFTASIPIGNQDVEYYIHAVANSGKSMSRPIVAPDGFWRIAVETLDVESWAANHLTGPVPNPATDKVRFHLDRIPGEVSVSVTNLLGQTLRPPVPIPGDGILEIDLDASWNGIVLVSFRGSFGTIARKVVIGK